MKKRGAPKQSAKPKVSPSEKVLSLDFLPRSPRKSEVTQIRILEAAVKCYATVGFEEATFEKIGDTAGVSRPLIIRYFVDRPNLLLSTIKYVRHLFQSRAVEAIKNAKTTDAELAAYVRSTFQWALHDRNHATVWILFYYYCARLSEWTKLNDHFTQTGEARIRDLLKRAGAANPGLRAKQVQLIITGALMCLMTEKPWDDFEKIQEQTIALCKRVAELA